MIRINNNPILNKYNLNKDKMSNSIKEDIGQYKKNSLTIDELLHNLKLELNKTNRAILIELIKTNMPLKEDFFIDISKFLDSFDNDAEMNLQAKIKVALLLKKLNLPLNMKFFNLFKENTELKDELLKELNNWTNKATLANVTDKEESSQKISKLLKEFNVEENPKNKEILKSMSKFELELNKENFISISKELSSSDSKQIQLVTLLKKLQLPINNQALKELFSQLKLNNSDSLATSMKKLISTLLVNESKPDSSALILPKIKEIIDQNPKILVEIKEALPKKDFELLSKKINLSAEDEVKILKKIVKEELSQKIITPNNLTVENLKDSLTTLNSNNDKADKLLKTLFHLTADNSSEEVAQSSDKLLKQLLVQRTLNYNNDITTLFLPFFIEENINLAEIKVNHEGKNSSSENDDLNLSFAVRTPKLGEVEIKLKIKDKQLNGLLNTDNSKTLKLLQENLNLLRSNLGESDYQVNYLACKLLEQEVLTSNQEEIKMTNVDFKI